jgi:VIT1/CCC1 family predicted Fe2+/Mn2+ transporter
MERISEVLFALIMALTFTCSFSVADAGREEVRTMLFGALGCNLAWGIIDAVFYLMACFSARGRAILTLGALRQVSSPAVAHQIIARALPPVLVSVLSTSDLETMRERLTQVRNLPREPRLSKQEWLGAFGVFLIVVLATFPVTIPFALISDARVALRTSNGVAVIMLFIVGYAFGKYAGHRPWRMAIAMVLLGGAMVGITISLGG